MAIKRNTVRGATATLTTLIISQLLLAPVMAYELKTTLPDGGTYSSAEWNDWYRFSYSCPYAMKRAKRTWNIEVFYEMQKVMLKVLEKENQASSVTIANAQKEVNDWIKEDEGWRDSTSYVKKMCNVNLESAKIILEREKTKLLSDDDKASLVAAKDAEARKEQYDNLQKSVRGGAICHYFAKATSSPTKKIWKSYSDTSSKLLLAYGQKVQFDLDPDSVMIESESIKGEVGSYHGAYRSRCANWFSAMTNELKKFKAKLKVVKP